MILEALSKIRLGFLFGDGAGEGGGRRVLYNKLFTTRGTFVRLKFKTKKSLFRFFPLNQTHFKPKMPDPLNSGLQS